MQIRRVLLCLFWGWPLAGWGEDPATSVSPADANAFVRPAGDVSNITEYLEQKFQIPARPVSEAPPGSNDVVTTDGRIFRNVQVWKTEPDGLTLRHDAGLTKLEFPLLPEDWQKKYGYDPEQAATYQRGVADAMQEAARNQQLLREQIAADRAKETPEEPR